VLAIHRSLHSAVETQLKRSFSAGMFTAKELADRYLRQNWIDPGEIISSLQFEGWTAGTKAGGGDGAEKGGAAAAAAADAAVDAGVEGHTPRCMRELIAYWASQPNGNEVLQRWLMWVTGSDNLQPGVSIRVLPTLSAQHLPEATTCSREMRLPRLDRGDGVERLSAKLMMAMEHSSNSFGTE
jgi:hypothetical protein